MISPALSFGSLKLATPLLLSPLAGYTNLPFRRVIRELGSVGLCTTDLVNARSLLEKNRKALKLIESSPEDTPLAVQLFGAVPEEMRDAAVRLEALGIASVDINMGCPVRKVCKVGGGAFDELEGLAILLEEGAGVDEVGGAEADAADLADDAAEGEVGVPGQRREEQRRRQLKAAKGKGGGFHRDKR